MENSVHSTRKAGRPLSFDRHEALVKAMHAFWRTGYETTSISDLTAAMGITAPSLYGAYGDKQQLFLEAMHLYAGSPYALDEALARAETSYAAAETMLKASAEAFTGDGTPRGCLLASATASGSRASRDVQAAVADVRRTIQRRLEARIEADVANGVLPADANAGALARLVIATIQGMSVLARDGVERRDLLDMVEIVLHAWPAGERPSRSERPAS